MAPNKSPKSPKTVSQPKPKSKSNELLDSLLPEVRQYFAKTLGFTEFTPVQKTTVKYFLNNYDCIVQAPTGSGKTLAYILPLLQILKDKCTVQIEKTEICGLILVPSRDLVHQVGSVIRPALDILGFGCAALESPTSKKKKSEEKKIKGSCVVISTPGRLLKLIDDAAFKTALKSLEMLIIDEADRFCNVDFKDATTKILGVLPKQRRTGLFSATQAKDMEDLIKFGLRNPVRLEVTGDAKTFIDDDKPTETSGTPSANTVAPSSLVNKFVTVEASHKLAALVHLIKKRPKEKILVFFSTRFAVVYFERVLDLLFGKSRKIVKMHGKKFGRSSVIAKFNKTDNPVLLATDCAGRGLDLENVDTVIQFDIPKLSSWFVHRVGRAGRNGRAGESILLLTQEEAAYAEFITTHESIKLVEGDDTAKVGDKQADNIREALVGLATAEREFLELGTAAFVALVKFYLSHDCQIVCKLWDLDIAGLANAYGLIRMPPLSELKRVDISGFQRVDIETGSIPYKDPKKEQARQKKVAEFQGQKRIKFFKKDNKPKKRKSTEGDEGEETTPEPKKKRKRLSEWDELQTEQRLLKKLKKGKMQKTDVNAAMDDL